MRVINHMSGDQTLRLSQAVLIYEGEQGAAFASVNPIRSFRGRPRIQAGRCLSREDLALMSRELAGRAEKREIPPAHVLYADSGRVLWHRPAARRPIFFHTGKKEFDQALNGRHALYPALLFLAEPQNLYVWALAADDRPGMDTPVYRAPFLNLYETGHMCAGTTKLPLAVSAEVAPFERAFYETTFTHSNYRDSLCRHPEGHDGLWRALAEPRRKRVPVEWLLPLQGKSGALTAGEVLNR